MLPTSPWHQANGAEITGVFDEDGCLALRSTVAGRRCACVAQHGATDSVESARVSSEMLQLQCSRAGPQRSGNLHP
jgi:hypothetical protein